MATIKAFSDLQQSKKLAEILPIESADMYWWSSGKRYYIEAMDDGDFNEEEGHVRAWSLSALLDVLPVSCDDEFYPKPNKKSKPNQYGWINIYRYGKFSQVGVEIFKTEEEALANIVDGTYIDTVKIIWKDNIKNQI